MTKAKATEEETPVEQEAEAEAQEEAPQPPKTRYVSVAIELQLKTDDDRVSAEAVEAACAEQIVLPSAVHTQPGTAVLIGVTAGGVSESETPTEIDGGYGREAPPKEDES